MKINNGLLSFEAFCGFPMIKFDAKIPPLIHHNFASLILTRLLQILIAAAFIILDLSLLLLLIFIGILIVG